MFKFQRQGALRRGTWKTAVLFSTLEIYFGFWMTKGNGVQVRTVEVKITNIK